MRLHIVAREQSDFHARSGLTYFSFDGVINGVRLQVPIKLTGTPQYAFKAKANRHY